MLLYVSTAARLAGAPRGTPRLAGIRETEEERLVTALIVLLLIVLLFGGLGFAAHVLWIVLVVALVLWVLGFFLGGAEAAGRRRWYGR